jgi:ubiquinone/menaquinone biosynthesis C-methylase UbiE/spore coat polysaccharide biosynthesis protein SpsF (cytidylyltransferase family)
MNKVCFIQCHYTDESFLLDKTQNPISKLKESNVFDNIVLGVADIDENHEVFDKYAEQYDIDVFYGESLDIVDRMLRVCWKYDAQILSRILINWNYVDLSLIKDMILYADSVLDLDYLMLPYDFDIKFGCDLHTKSGLSKLKSILNSNKKLQDQYSFRPWSLLESDNRFNSIIYQDVPEYTNKIFYDLQNVLLENMPVAWDYYSVFYYHEYEIAKEYLTEDDIVLDVSCGHGNGSAVLARNCRKIYAFDVVEDFLKKGKENYGKLHNNIEFVHGEPEKNLPLDDESITFAVSVHTMEHVKDDSKFLSEIYRVLKKGGYLFIEVPVRVAKPFSGNSEPLVPHTDTYAGHYREYSPESFTDLVGSFFKVLKLNGVSRGAYVPIERTRNAVMALLQK